MLSYASNLVFKLREEKKADLFAVQHSSVEDIQEAASFFEEHQHILDRYSQPGGLLTYLPSTIVSGHPNGKVRAAYLRRCLKIKP